MRDGIILYILYHLAKIGGLKGVSISTINLGNILNISQQSASRWLNYLEREGYIVKELRGNKSFITITDKGRRFLEKLYLDLRIIFEKEKNILFRIRGRVFTGFGEGAYYVSLPGYKKQFIEKLGFEPYPGTLNLKLDSESVRIKRELELMDGITIEGFTYEGRRYGSVKCFKALIEDRVKGAVLLIERTHYGLDVIEVIAPVNLRETLKLKDGDLVNVAILL